jgi:tyrosinase
MDRRRSPTGSLTVAPAESTLGQGIGSMAGAAVAQLLDITRRQLLQLATLVGGAAAAGVVVGCTPAQQEAIANRPVRKDIANLSENDPDVVSYKAAITAMKALDQSSPADSRGWAKQAQIHYDHCRHGSWLFFPWHRAYLWYFEEICRQLSGNNAFALPYWDWTTHPTVPDLFWNQSSPLYDASRAPVNGVPVAPQWVGPDIVIASSDPSNPAIMQEPNFLVFGGDATTSGLVEQTPHNHVHTHVGGAFGHMATYHSPLDPIFWSHHANVDRLWVEWNLDAGNPNTNDSAWTGTQFNEFVDRTGNPVTVPMLFNLLLPLLSYRYDTQGV